MSQRAFIQSVASRHGVNTISGLPASQPVDRGPRRKGNRSVISQTELRLEV